jgi:hypothetical protein
MSRPFRPPSFELRNAVWRVVCLWLSSLCTLLHPPVTSSLLGPNIPLSTLFSGILESLFSSLNMTNRVSHLSYYSFVHFNLQGS